MNNSPKDTRPWATHEELVAWINGEGLVRLEDIIIEDEELEDEVDEDECIGI